MTDISIGVDWAQGDDKTCVVFIRKEENEGLVVLAELFGEAAEYVAKLEADRDEYRNLYHMAEAKISSREAIIEQLSESELAKDVTRLEAELEKIICHWCEAEVTEDEANEHYKSCTKNPLRAENETFQELFVYFFGENYEELAGGDAEKQFAQSLSKRTTPLSDEEKRNALTGDE